MMKVASSIEKQVKAFCAQVGTDPLLVQGAGGNVSWKDGDILWVKASGTWLAEAQSKEIFVPVDLVLLRDAIAKKDFHVKPEVIIKSDLRPSIETLLHAVMPHKVVVHLHAVEILVYLVQLNAREQIQRLVGNSCDWVYVEYIKPGAELASAVADQLSYKPAAEVVLLANHGIVIGGETIQNVLLILNNLLSRVVTKKAKLTPKNFSVVHDTQLLELGYMPVADKGIGCLSRKKSTLSRLRNDWSLYPDHVVFLGAKAELLETNFTKSELEQVVSANPPFIFSVQDGAYESSDATPAQKAQLRCYFDVISRQESEKELRKLNDMQVAELLNWDAEKYRKDTD
jgi:rhamnose utilization protein RhaD (predicted bifunctional aldolase and dehydrogenase)